jgi:hypothetical protein
VARGKLRAAVADDPKDELSPSRTWWDRGDEPPESLVHALEAAKRGARIFVPPATSQEGSRGRWIRLVVLAAIFLTLVWLVFLGLVHQG